MSTFGLAGMPTPAIDWSSPDLPREFSRFKKLCELMWCGPLAGIEENRQLSYLLLWAGEEGRELAESWNMTEDAKVAD